MDSRALTEGIGMAQFRDTEGRRGALLENARAFLLGRGAWEPSMQCFSRLVPLFMPCVACKKATLIERAAMHGFALAFLDEQCYDTATDACTDDDDATVPARGVLGVAKKSEPGPQGVITYIALANKNADDFFYWSECDQLCRSTPSDAEPRTGYYVVVRKSSDKLPPKTLSQVVDSIVACFKEYSCRFAEDVTDFTKLFPDVPLWEFS